MKVLHFNTNDKYKDFKQKFNAEKPDIVHIHDVWSFKVCCVEHYARKNRVPIVLSPGRQLMPWHVQHHYFIEKLPMIILFVKRLIQNAEAIQVNKKQEKDVLIEQGWNERVEHTNQIEELYKKVMDSNAFLYFTDREKKVENTLLRLGLSRDEDSAIVTTDSVSLVREIGPSSWRNIAIHAYDENITDVITSGVRTLLMSSPLPDVTNIVRFKSTIIKDNSPLPIDAPLTKRNLFNEVADEKHAKQEEKTITIALINTIYLIQKKNISRRALADLYTLLRFTNYNEVRLEQMLQIMKLKKPSARILQILSETIGLEEGFMPFEPINDKKTQSMKKTLNNINVQ